MSEFAAVSAVWAGRDVPRRVAERPDEPAADANALVLALVDGPDWAGGFGRFASLVLAWDGWESVELWVGAPPHLHRLYVLDRSTGVLRRSATPHGAIGLLPMVAGRDPSWDVDATTGTATLAIPVAAAGGVDGCIVMLATRPDPGGLAVLREAAPVISAMAALRMQAQELDQTMGIVAGQDTAVVRVDHEQRIVSVNAAWTTLTGFGPEATIGHSVLDFVWADDLDGAREVLAEAFATVGGTEAEGRVTRADGAEVWVHVRLAIDDDAMLTIAARDVSTRKLSEELIAGQRAAITHLFDESPVPHVAVDRQGVVLRASESFCCLLGLPSERVVGAYLDRFAHEDEQGMAAQFVQGLAGTHAVVSLPHRLVRDDGAVIDVVVTAQAVYGAAGEYQQTIVVAQDVTVQKRTEAKLAESRELLELLVTNTTDVIALINAAGRYEYISPSVRDVLGRSPEEFVGRHLLEFVHPEDHEKVQAPQVAGPERDRVMRLTFRSPHADGRWRWMEAIVLPLFDEQGNLTHVQSSLRDITARVEMEGELAAARDQALEAVRLKAAFLANMSHEIRTPMNGVIGLTELLADTHLSAEQTDYVRTIRSSAETLLTIINDILDFSKIESGKLTIEQEPFDLREVTRSVVLLLDEKANEKGLALGARVDEDVPRLVVGDSVRLRQVLTNLVGNAIKFTERGSVEVTMDVSRRFEDGGLLLHVRVKDTGVGMSGDAQRRIFKEFEQADVSTTRRFGGTGLGLSICKQLVELMGGSIGVVSEPGVGSEFFFDIHLGSPAAGGAVDTVVVPAPGTEAAFEAAASVTAGATPGSAIGPGLGSGLGPGLGGMPGRLGHGTHVLLAEDNPVNQKVAVRNLEKMGCRVDVVANGRAAVEAALQTSYDVVLMDCQMPVLDGFSASRELRARGCTSPIVALTANAMVGDRERCLAAGMDDYLTKPLRVPHLHAMLAKHSGAVHTERPTE